MKPLCYLNTGKSNAAAMMTAFAKGSGAEVTTDLKFRPGRTAVFWGVDRVTLPLWDTVRNTGTPFYYIDNGYFLSKWAGGDYYRITYNAERHDGKGESAGLRWRTLGLKIVPWTMSGDHILLASQTDFWHERHGDGSAAEWVAKTRAGIAKHSKRKIVVRAKPLKGHTEPPLAQHLRNAWAVVTYSSIVAAEGLLAGVPAIILAGGGDLAQSENPPRPDDRLRWASVLADNQWTLREIENGTAWSHLTNA